MGSHGRVLALEPSPRLFDKLRATIDRNRLGNVRALNFGCGSATGQTVLRQVSQSSGNATLASGGNEGASEDVQIHRLDEIPEALIHPPQLIKMDVEGFERRCMREGVRSLSNTGRCCTSSCAATTGTRRGKASLSSTTSSASCTALQELDLENVPNGSNFVVGIAGGRA